MTMKGLGKTCVSPSIVTCRSSIASRSAAWVFGLARLISSASRICANTGPGRNSNSLVFWLYARTPVTSEGSRSGVNWMRRNVQSSERASDLASIVLPTPGTSSMRRCPSHRRVTRQSRISSSLLTIARLTFDMNASATRPTASLPPTPAIIDSPSVGSISVEYGWGLQLVPDMYAISAAFVWRESSVRQADWVRRALGDFFLFHEPQMAAHVKPQMSREESGNSLHVQRPVGEVRAGMRCALDDPDLARPPVSVVETAAVVHLRHGIGAAVNEEQRPRLERAEHIDRPARGEPAARAQPEHQPGEPDERSARQLARAPHVLDEQRAQVAERAVEHQRLHARLARR